MTQPTPPKSFQQYVIEAIASLFALLNDLIHTTARLEQKVDTLMSLPADLAAAKAELSDALGDVAEAIEHQIQQLADAIALNADAAAVKAAAEDALAGFTAAAQQVRGMETALKADDEAAPPAP
jgi:peptidoglycan hydrolase CwlO-like protein